MKYIYTLLLMVFMGVFAVGSSESSDKLDLKACAETGARPVIDALIENYKKDESKTIAQKQRIEIKVGVIPGAMNSAFVGVGNIANPILENFTEAKAKEANMNAYMYAFEELNGKTAEEIADLIEQNPPNERMLAERAGHITSLHEKWNQRLIDYYQNKTN